jgi:hypothetical protein
MCCFSQPIDYVAATKIFARPAKGGGQYLVYSMTLKAGTDLAMILPIPTPKASKEEAVEFINLEKYSDFFDDMHKGFPVPLPAGRATKDDAPRPKAAPEPKLKVVEVGSFVASFVPTVKDFARLDDQFKLPEGTWNKLPQYKDYGFAVFKLKKGEHRVHPMAFQFPRAEERKLFFPTVHIHDGKVHDRAGFDHDLFSQGGDSGGRWEESPQPAEMFMKKLDQARGIVSARDHVYRKRMIGNYKNEDIWL